MTRARDVATQGGLVLLNTTTLSGTSVTVNNIFSSTYNNYLIVCDDANAQTSVSDMFLQFRASGTTTAANYNNSLIYNNSGGGPLKFASNNVSSLIVGAMGDYTGGKIINIYGPNIASKTKITGSSAAFALTNVQHTSFFGIQTDNIQFDGFILSHGFAMSGTIRVYGYKNS